MIIADKLQLGTKTLTNFAVNGSFAISDIDEYSNLILAQTTPDITITIPAPSVINTTANNILKITNPTGNVSVTIDTTLVHPNTFMDFIFDGTVWIPCLDGVPNTVTIQAISPLITSPVGPTKTDIVIDAIGGVEGGAVESFSFYNGTTWVKAGQDPIIKAVDANTPRTYFGAPTSYFASQAGGVGFTVPQLTALGMTAVGAATLADRGAWSSRRIAYNWVNPPTAANMYTVPVDYIRHEVAITPGVDNIYMQLLLGDRTDTKEIWFCDPTTGVPVKRLMANACSKRGGFWNDTGIGPFEGGAGYEDYYGWTGWFMNAANIALYKTAGNTIKLALRAGMDNQFGGQTYYCGHFVAPVNYAFLPISGLLWNNFSNESNQIASRKFAYSGDAFNRSYANLAANSTFTVMVPIPDPAKSYTLSFATHGQSAQGAGECQNDTWRIVSATNGNLELGVGKAGVVPYRVRKGTPYGHQWYGRVLPSEIIQQKMYTPTNSAISYIDLQITTDASSAHSVAGGHLEEV